MVIGTPIGIVVAFVVIWYSFGLNVRWAKRHNNRHYRSLVTYCTACKVHCLNYQQPQSQPVRARQRDPRVARIRRTAVQPIEQSPQVQEITVEPVQPSAPSPQPPSEPVRTLTKTPPPQYSVAISYPQPRVDLPPSYSEAATASISSLLH